MAKVDSLKAEIQLRSNLQVIWFFAATLLPFWIATRFESFNVIWHPISILLALIAGTLTVLNHRTVKQLLKELENT